MASSCQTGPQPLKCLRLANVSRPATQFFRVILLAASFAVATLLNRTRATQHRLAGASPGCTQTGPIQTYASFVLNNFVCSSSLPMHISAICQTGRLCTFQSLFGEAFTSQLEGQTLRKRSPSLQAFLETRARRWRSSRMANIQVYKLLFPPTSYLWDLLSFLLTTVPAYVIAQRGGKVPGSASYIFINLSFPYLYLSKNLE